MLDPAGWPVQVGAVKGWFCVLACSLIGGVAAAQLPDLSTVDADLKIPRLTAGEPGPGKRVKHRLPTHARTKVYHVLYLPSDWEPGRKYPVLVEYAGNQWGATSSGTPEGSRLGYGISGGKGFLWLCLPYLNGDGTANVSQWWGSKPAYDPQPTIDYCLEAVPWVCEKFGGDRGRVVLCGFSRGAIACNFIGLHDDRIARLWKAFIPYSHYDGVVTGWPYPGVDRPAARERLQRLAGRPQFICGEGKNAEQTAIYLGKTGVEGDFTIRGTGFRNHDDAWVLRPSPARKELREWLARVLAD